MYEVSDFEEISHPLLNSTEQVQHAKSLVGRLFIGHFKESRRVDELAQYRDVVIISPRETDLVQKLQKIRPKLEGVKWVGYTGPEDYRSKSGHCFWVKLKPVHFGYYWFQIKQIRCEDGEIIFVLKIIRSVDARDFEVHSEERETKKKAGEVHDGQISSNNQFSEYTFDFDPEEMLKSGYTTFINLVKEVVSHVTWANSVVVCKFMVQMSILLAITMRTCIWHFGEFGLIMVDKLIIFCKLSTPIMLSMIDAFTKVICKILDLIQILLVAKGRQESHVEKIEPSQKWLVGNTRRELEFRNPSSYDIAKQRSSAGVRFPGFPQFRQQF